MPSELLTERRGSTLLLTISDPASRNALSEQVVAAGVEALNVAESDPSVRCIILQGDGAHFCVGAEWLPSGADHIESGGTLQRLQDFVEGLRVFPKPVIAAVEGMAAAAGFSLALACDLIVAADDAKFTLSPTAEGLASMGVTSRQSLHRLPRSLALQMCWLGEPAPVRQLHEWGLVNWTAPPGQALARALEIAEALSREHPDAVARAKEWVNQWPQSGELPR
jgi:enoyl-CoA hydratase/carnithine racemase